MVMKWCISSAGSMSIGPSSTVKSDPSFYAYSNGRGHNAPDSLYKPCRGGHGSGTVSPYAYRRGSLQALTRADATPGPPATLPPRSDASRPAGVKKLTI